MEDTTIRNKSNNTNEKKRYIIEHHEPHCLQPERIQEIHATLGKQKPREKKKKKTYCSFFSIDTKTHMLLRHSKEYENKTSS